MRAALLVVLLAGCASSVPVAEVQRAETPWCFRLDVGDETALGCTETRATCRKALKTARTYGPAAGVERVTDCEEVR